MVLLYTRWNCTNIVVLKHAGRPELVSIGFRCMCAVTWPVSVQVTSCSLNRPSSNQSNFSQSVQQYEFHFRPLYMWLTGIN